MVACAQDDGCYEGDVFGRLQSAQEVVENVLFWLVTVYMTSVQIVSVQDTQCRVLQYCALV